jgi:hypothetical protein
MTNRVKIEGYDNYVIFPSGNIRNILTDKLLNANNGEGFYNTVRLRKDGKAKTFKLHRLLAQAFIPNPENKPCVNHKDGNKLNNDLSNLEWCTHKENMKHAYDNGMLFQSEKNKQALLESKRKIVLNLENGIFHESIKEAAETYNTNGKVLAKRLDVNKRKFLVKV